MEDMTETYQSHTSSPSMDSTPLAVAHQLFSKTGCLVCPWVPRFHQALGGLGQRESSKLPASPPRTEKAGSDGTEAAGRGGEGVVAFVAEVKVEA